MLTKIRKNFGKDKKKILKCRLSTEKVKPEAKPVNFKDYMRKKTGNKISEIRRKILGLCGCELYFFGIADN